MEVKKLIGLCNVILIVATCYGLIQITQAIEMFWGMTSSSWLSVEFLQQIGLVLTVILVCVLLWILVLNAKKKEIFTKKNEKLLFLFGKIIAFTGTVLLCIIALVTDTSLPSCNDIILIILLGIILSFFSAILRIGRNISEENDLTV